MNRAVICLWLICRVVFSGAVPPWNDEQRLLENLLDTPGRYDRRVRPVQNATQPADVHVVFGQERIVILNLDSKHLKLNSATSFSVQWEDKRLSWSPDDYGGVEYMIVNTKDIWYPRLIIRKDDEQIGVLGDSTESLLMYNGTVNTMNMLKYNTHCFFKLAKFPFDRQTCAVSVGFSTTPESIVRLFPRLTKNYNFRITEEWNVLNITLQTNKIKCANFEVDLSDTSSVDWVKSPRITDPRCLHTSDIIMTIHLERRWLMYIFSVIAPSTILAVIAAAIFWLPPECGEKLSFGVSILLGFVVFQTLVQAALPEGGGNGESQAVLSFIVSNFFLSGGSVLLTAVTLTLHHREVATRKTVDVNHCGTTQEENNDLRRDVDALEDENSKVTVVINWKMIARRLDMVGFVLYVGGFFVNIIFLLVRAATSD